MVSELALADIERLGGVGIALTPQEIIRLNAFGCKVEYGERSSTIYHKRRCAFLGDLVFQEPTIGHDIWFEDVGKIIDLTDSFSCFTTKAYMLCHDQEELNDEFNAETIQKQIFEWTNKHLRRFTPRQILNCIYYVTYGNFADENEIGKCRQDDANENEEDKFDWENTSIALGVIRDAQAHRLGISLADAKNMSKGELSAVIKRAEILDNKFDGKKEHSEAVGDYYSVVEEIENAHKQEVLTNG